jgi:hypothetical protein
MADWREREPIKQMIAAARSRARRLGYTFSITTADLPSDLPAVCPVLGIPLERSESSYSDNSPTLDRVDSTKGYVPGNVIIMSWRANRIKSNATLGDIKKIYEFMAKWLRG